MKNTSMTLTEIVLLIITSLATISFLVRSLLTGEDLPTGWTILIGSSWGALLGVKEFLNRSKM